MADRGDMLGDHEGPCRILAESIGEVVCLVSRDGVFRFGNSIAAQRLGCSPEDLVGRTMWDVFPKDVADRHVRAIRHVIDSGQSADVESHEPLRDGLRWYRTSIRPLRLGDAPAEAAVVVARDITEQKEMERQLAEREAEFRAIFEQSPIAVELFDAEGWPRIANEAFTKLFGLSDRNRIPRLNLFDDPNVPRNLRDMLLSEGVIRLEATIDFDEVRRTGYYETSRSGVIYLEVIISVLRQGDGGAVSGYLLRAANVTERRRAQRALEVSEEKYRQLFETETDAIVLFDDETGLFVDMNRAAIEMFGYTREEFLRLSYKDLTDEPTESDRAFLALKQGQPIHLPARRYRRKDGSIVSVEIRASSIILGGRKTMFGVLRDITERLRAEEELLRSESMLAESQRIAHLGSWDWDIPTDTLTWSSETYRIFGVSEESFEVSANSFLALVHPDDIEDLMAAINRSLLEQLPYSAEHRIIRPDGEQRIVLEQGQFYYGPDGRPYRSVGTARDVTEQRQAEAALRDSEEKYRALTENTVDVIYSVDEQGHVIYISPQARRYRLDPAEIVGRHFTEFVHPEDRMALASAFRVAVETGVATPSEFRVIGGDGVPYWFEERSTVRRSPSGAVTGQMGVLRDVGERKKAEQEALEYEHRLRSLAMELFLAEERERKRLATDVHDNLLQLLAVARMKLAVAADTEDPAARSSALGEVGALLDRANRSTRSLTFHMSHPALYDMGLVPAAEWLAEDMKSLYGLTVVMRGPHGADPLEQRTRVVLFQCLRELLVNVVKHAATQTAEVDVFWDASAARVTVVDEGLGFEAESAQARMNHTKFGLFSIGERMRMLGGRMTVESHPGQGTVVTLAIPLTEGRDERREVKL